MGNDKKRSAMTEQVRKLGQGVVLAEEVRNQKSADNLFAGIFSGRPSLLDKVFTEWPKPTDEEVRKRNRLVIQLSGFLQKSVDPYLIDSDSSIPWSIFQAMSALGLYGIKVPEKWGGHGLSQTSYAEVLSMAASWCSAIVIVLSADNTIGCKFPVMYYGTDKQKDLLLPELVKWPTGFCLTEEDAGSDASHIKTYAVRVKDTNNRTTGYELTGQKWYTTNGIFHDKQCLAKYLAVVARIVSYPEELDDKGYKECFGLFIVPTGFKGVEIGCRNSFIGMRGIHNSNPRFEKVFVPVFNLIGEKRSDWEKQYGWGEREGSGLKIAFESLNTGRIAIANGCIGVSKQALHLSRWWAKKRNQLGGPLCDKELVRDKLLFGASNILAMEAMAQYASQAFDNGQDVRLEAAAVKTFASEKSWQIVDNMMQTRGGRGYETWQSLSKRELTPPDDIIWTGSRPNKIFEGSNEVMVQFIFREGADKFIKTGLPLVSKESSMREKVLAVLAMAKHYLGTFVPNIPPKENIQILEDWLWFLETRSRKLARKIITKSARYRQKMPLKQLTMDRFSRIAINLGAMAMCYSYAQQLDKDNPGKYIQLADVFCRATATEIDRLFEDLDNNQDERRFHISKQLLNGDFDKFLLKGIIPITEEHMRGPK
ncbi:MAG: acyl-CoA dehydrogenase family protein [bacterium]|nr:acyl-CoA dehydrogenase family protein [bacterium]